MKTVLFPFVGDRVGGSHIAARILMQNLSSINYKFKVLILRDDRILSKYFLDNQIQTTSIIKNNNGEKHFLLRDFFIFFKFIKKYVQDNNIDIVHTNDLRMHYFWSLISIFSKIKHIWHQHTPYWSRRNLVFSFFSKEVLTVSKWCKSSFVKNMSVRAKIVGNPFEINKFKISQKKIRKQKNVLYIGKKVVEKRARFCVDIAKNVNMKDKNIVFNMLGDLPFKEKEKNELRGFNIFFHEKNYDIYSFLENTDLLLAPNVDEGFGRPVIEAMLSKVLVLAANDGAYKELIINNKTGFLARKDNLEDFTNKILLIFSNYEFDDIKNRAYLGSRRKFNIDVYLKKILNVYKNL